MTRSKFDYIEVATLSDPGLVRKNNEDSYGCLPEAGCFFAADGMGGGAAGEVASHILVEYVSDQIAKTADDIPGHRKYVVQQAIHKANREILNYSRQYHYQFMGTTLALLLLDPWNSRQALICHIGDSRIYRLRKNELVCLTTDHTVGAALAAKTSQTLLSDHQHSSISHILTRAVGTSANALPEWQSIEVEPEDIFLICSDGVSTMLADQTIREIMNSSSALDEIKVLLSDAICQAGAFDNYTFILCKAAPELPEKELHSEDDMKENDYLAKIAEERIDYA